MELIKFDLSRSMDDLAHFKQMATDSAIEMNNIFQIQLSELSALFEEAANNATTSFVDVFSEIDMAGEASFVAMQENATMFTDNFTIGLQEIQTIGEEATGWQYR